MKQPEQLPDFQGSTCTPLSFKVNEQVGLRVFKFLPESDTGKLPVVILTGLATQIESFGKVVEALAKNHPVYYIETREKSSSQISGKVTFYIETMGEDVVHIVKQLELKNGQYLLLGYSMGATILADCYHSLNTRPFGLVLIEPTPVFHYPAWSIVLIRYFGVLFYLLLKALAKWYLGRYRINKEEDFEMAQISSQSLDNANPSKLRSTVLAISHYQVWEKLPAINCPTLIAGTSKDGLHVKNEVERMVHSIKGCQYIDMETNERTHSAEMAEVIEDFLVQETLEAI